MIGENELGFTKDEVGLHSIRSGGAMAMFLSGVSDIIIQRIGRWESFAFLEYIREQVENFTYGVLEKMLQHEKYYHMNDKNLPRQQDRYSNDKATYRGNGETSLDTIYRGRFKTTGSYDHESDWPPTHLGYSEDGGRGGS